MQKRDDGNSDQLFSFSCQYDHRLFHCHSILFFNIFLHDISNVGAIEMTVASALNQLHWVWTFWTAS